MRTTTVYLICFHPGIPRGTRPGNACHYLGSTSYLDAAERVREHFAGTGSPLVKAAHDRGLHPEIVATWTGLQADRARDEAPPPPRALLPALQHVAQAAGLRSNFPSRPFVHERPPKSRPTRAAADAETSSDTSLPSPPPQPFQPEGDPA